MKGRRHEGTEGEGDGGTEGLAAVEAVDHGAEDVVFADFGHGEGRWGGGEAAGEAGEEFAGEAEAGSGAHGEAASGDGDGVWAQEQHGGVVVERGAGEVEQAGVEGADEAVAGWGGL